MDLVYKNEKRLFALMLLLSLLAWGLLLVGTMGTVIVYVLFGFLFYCFAQSALISYIKGTGVRITAEQFPDLERQIAASCRKLGIAEEPDAYLLQMGGALNAFATRFFGRDFLVLYSDVVDGLADDPDALNFYIGHELGHIKQKHLTWSTVLMPAAILPLVGPAYSRAREYTCDRHGLAACDSPASAERGLAVLAAGGKRARSLNTEAYIEQSRQTEGFWMSFHELVGDYPWLVKRMAAVRALGAGYEIAQPSRNKLAALLALFVPRFGMGGGGAVVTVAIVGILAAVAIPAYQEYTQKAKTASAYLRGQDAADKVGRYYMARQSLPATLAQAGVAVAPDTNVAALELDQQDGVLRMTTQVAGPEGSGVLVFSPALDADKRVVWRCTGEHLKPSVLPAACR